jgi:hypothetical protein
MNFQIVKKITELNMSELDLLYCSAYPNIPQVIEDRIISYEDEYVIITNFGCSLVIWEDYQVELFSDVMPVHRINIINIMSALLSVGAIKLINICCEL